MAEMAKIRFNIDFILIQLLYIALISKLHNITGSGSNDIGSHKIRLTNYLKPLLRSRKTFFEVKNTQQSGHTGWAVRPEEQ